MRPARPGESEIGLAPTRDGQGALLRVEHLRKTYGDVVAVDDVSFEIPPGICFGLLGPNGAGKSTTIEIIEGITRESAGTILYRGQPRDARFKEVAGIQFQATALMDFLTVAEMIETFRAMYPAPMATRELVEMCELDGFLDRDVAKLSGGQRQRVLLALALVNDPEILFLDEPTTGLDPQSRRNLWRLIDDIRAAGKTIVLTTHYMDEAEQLCDDLAIMDQGRIIARGAPKALLAEHYDYVMIFLDAGVWPEGIALSDPVRRAGNDVIIESRSVKDSIDELLARDVPLTSLKIRNPTLEDLFIKLTGHRLRE